MHTQNANDVLIDHAGTMNGNIVDIEWVSYRPADPEKSATKRLDKLLDQEAQRAKL